MDLMRENLKAFLIGHLLVMLKVSQTDQMMIPLMDQLFVVLKVNTMVHHSLF